VGFHGWFAGRFFEFTGKTFKGRFSAVTVLLVGNARQPGRGSGARVFFSCGRYRRGSTGIQVEDKNYKIKMKKIDERRMVGNIYLAAGEGVGKEEDGERGRTGETRKDGWQVVRGRYVVATRPLGKILA